MQIGVLGRLQVVRHGTEIDLGPHKQRALLTALALHAGEVVSLDRLADLVWGDLPPAAVTASVHGYVAALRRLLEPDRTARSAATVLLTAPPGYRLQLSEATVDAAEFTSTAEAVHRLAPSDVLQLQVPHRAPELEELLDRVETALSLWRGDPYLELDTHVDVHAERARLQELRDRAVQDRARILLALGRPSVAAADLADLVSRDPLREDTTAVLALSLARSGRQVEALQALRAHRGALAAELGLDPGPALRDLELAILRQDPHAVPATPAASPGVSAPMPQPPAPSDDFSDSTWASAEPLVGRDHELRGLRKVLDQAEFGQP